MSKIRMTCHVNMEFIHFYNFKFFLKNFLIFYKRLDKCLGLQFNVLKDLCFCLIKVNQDHWVFFMQADHVIQMNKCFLVINYHK